MGRQTKGLTETAAEVGMSIPGLKLSDAGRIRVVAEDTTNLPATRRQVGILFQS